MYVDPVVEEIRKNGERIVEECGGDIHRIAEYLRRGQDKHPDRVVRLADRTGRRSPGQITRSETSEPKDDS